MSLRISMSLGSTRWSIGGGEGGIARGGGRSSSASLRTQWVRPHTLLRKNKKPPKDGGFLFLHGGEGGIRTNTSDPQESITCCFSATPNPLKAPFPPICASRFCQ